MDAANTRALRSSEVAASVSDIVERAIAEGSIEGATVHVAQYGESILEHSAGTAMGAHIAPDSVWWLASITKAFVSAALMQLVDERAISLDAPIATYIPAFASPRRVRRIAPGSVFRTAPPFATADPNRYVFAPAERALTLRDLLTGTSGLQTIGAPNLEIRPIMTEDTLETFVNSLAHAPLDFQPGERWHYSNATAFEVAARVVEVASGTSIQDFMVARVFAPLAVTSTAFGLPERIAVNALPVSPFIAQHPMLEGFPSGSAGLFGTAGDIVRFGQMLLDGGTVQGVRVLTEKSVREMSANQIGALRLGGVNASEYGGFPDTLNPGVGYGYGMLALLDSDAADVGVPRGSFGWDGIGSRRFWVVPSASAIIVMLVEGTGAEHLHRQVERAVFATI